jgi:hypothetical protein
LAHLSDQVARPLCDPTPHNFVAVLRNPDDVVHEIKRRVRSVPVFSHSLIFKDLS